MATDIRLHPPAEPNRDSSGDGAFSVRSDPKLIAAGWTRRSLAGPDRAREVIDLYESLGYEVKAISLTPADFGPSCRDCAPVICLSYVLIYTRKADDAAARPRREAPDAAPDLNCGT